MLSPRKYVCGHTQGTVLSGIWEPALVGFYSGKDSIGETALKARRTESWLRVTAFFQVIKLPIIPGVPEGGRLETRVMERYVLTAHLRDLQETAT